MIRVSNLTVRAGAFAIERISFEVPPQAYAVLMGPTASGKTNAITRQRIIANPIAIASEMMTIGRPSQFKNSGP